MDIDHLRRWVGCTASVEDIVTPRLVAEYRATFDPHLFGVGQDGALNAGVAPPALHWCLAPTGPPMAYLGPDGHAVRGGFLPPVPLPRRMWAGGRLETHGPLRTGETVTRRSRVEDVAFKAGRSGPLVFVAVTHVYETARGPAITERHDIVYREAASAAPTPTVRDSAPTTPRPADLRWDVEASPVLLFRYSALTFNGHRIHYDAPYVTGVEGYAGLVVHGPLQATLCLNIAAALLGSVPRLFDYRNLSPLTAGAPFGVAAAKTPAGHVRCWTESADGRICLEAEASP